MIKPSDITAGPGPAGKGIVRRLIAWISRWGVGWSLLLASLPKLHDPGVFYEHVAAFGLLSDGAAEVVAWTLPVLELVVGLSLWSGVWLAGGMVWAIAMLAGFSGLQAWALTRGMEIPCGCFSLDEPVPISGWTFARAAGLLLLAVAGGLAVLGGGVGRPRRVSDSPRASRQRVRSVASGVDETAANDGADQERVDGLVSRSPHRAG